VGDGFGFVHLLSREDGTLLNRLATDGSAIASAPVAAGSTLIVVTHNGGVYGFVPE
jgi:outer membrane protein assembly factor BamB